jgi:hypothetical protein
MTNLWKEKHPIDAVELGKAPFTHSDKQFLLANGMPSMSPRCSFVFQASHFPKLDEFANGRDFDVSIVDRYVVASHRYQFFCYSPYLVESGVWVLSPRDTEPRDPILYCNSTIQSFLEFTYFEEIFAGEMSNFNYEEPADQYVFEFEAELRKRDATALDTAGSYWSLVVDNLKMELLPHYIPSWAQ